MKQIAPDPNIMKYSKFKYFRWVLSSLFFMGLTLYFLLSKNDLHPNHITSNIPPQTQWEVFSPTHEEKANLDKILEKPFVYFSEGGQSLVFLSTDRRYVFKLFKFKRFRPSVFVTLLPDVFPFKAYRERHIAKREKKLLAAFNGYKLAYDLHRQESGLTFIQLNPSNDRRKITLIDKNNKIRAIDLEKVSFILQERGEMLSEELAKLLDEGNLPTAKQRIDGLLTLYLSEYRKGIYDLDQGIMHNIGCLRERVFHLDPGKLVADERIKQREFYEADLIRTASHLQSWITQHTPRYSQELTQYLEERLSDILDKDFSFSGKSP